MLHHSVRLYNALFKISDNFPSQLIRYLFNNAYIYSLLL